MVHSTPCRVFMYGHWDDHAVDEIFLSLYKRGIHYTILTWGDLKEKMTWLDLTWTIMWLDLTWLEKNSNDLTWLATQVLLTWLDLWLEQGWLVTTLWYCEGYFPPSTCLTECTTFAPVTIAPMLNANVEHNPNPNPNPNPNLNPYLTLNQKRNRYPHSISLLVEISSQGQISDHRLTLGKWGVSGSSSVRATQPF